MALLLNVRKAAAGISDELHSTLCSLLRDDVLVPADKMEWKPVKALFRIGQQLRLVISTGKLPALNDGMSAIAEYIEHMESVYIGFAFSKKVPLLPWHQRLVRLQRAVEYFTAPRAAQYMLSNATDRHLKETVSSLETLWKWREEQAGSDNVRLAALDTAPWSHLSTLVVENFFSIIRSKTRYVILCQLCCVDHGTRAWIQVSITHGLRRHVPQGIQPYGVYDGSRDTRYTFKGTLWTSTFSTQIPVLIRKGVRQCERNHIQLGSRLRHGVTS